MERANGHIISYSTVLEYLVHGIHRTISDRNTSSKLAFSLTKEEFVTWQCLSTFRRPQKRENVGRHDNVAGGPPDGGRRQRLRFRTTSPDAYLNKQNPVVECFTLVGGSGGLRHGCAGYAGLFIRIHHCFRGASMQNMLSFRRKHPRGLGWNLLSLWTCHV